MVLLEQSHYIGPIHESGPFIDGKAAFDYISGRSHDGFRLTLPIWIDIYKTDAVNIYRESIAA